MIQSEIYMTGLTQGQSVDITTLNADNTGFTYSIHTLIVMGNSNDLITITVNDFEMELSPGTFLQTIPIRKVEVGRIMAIDTEGGYYDFSGGSIGPVSLNPGVMLIGQKTKIYLFN